jgi:hypothetical protein
MTRRINAVLIDIAGKFGKDIFRDAKKFNSVISDALPGFQNEEMRLLLVAAVAEFDAFIKAGNSIESNCSLLCKNLVEKLIQQDFNGDKAREAVCEVGQIIGIHDVFFCDDQYHSDSSFGKQDHKHKSKIDNYQVTKEAYDRYGGERNEIFISYSHKDARIANELINYLKNLTHNHNISVWHYVEMDGGIAINEEIGQRLKKAKIVIQLLSHHYINSEYIRTVERPIIRNGFLNDGLVTRWLKVGECSLLGTEFDGIQSVTKNLEPLNDYRRYPPARREKVYEEIAHQCRVLFGID